MKIVFLLHKSPEYQDALTVARLAEIFADQSHDVSIFLMEDGVYNVILNSSSKSLSAGFDNLLSKGVKIGLCTFTAEIRGITSDQVFKGVDFLSQYDLSKMIKECDHFLSFT